MTGITRGELVKRRLRPRNARHGLSEVDNAQEAAAVRSGINDPVLEGFQSIIIIADATLVLNEVL